MINLFKRAATHEASQPVEQPVGSSEELYLYIQLKGSGQRVVISTTEWDGVLDPHPFQEFIDWFTNGTAPGFTFKADQGSQVYGVSRNAVSYYNIERRTK